MAEVIRTRGLRSGVPEPSSEEARRRMESTGQRDTAAEMRIRQLLQGMGFRYRVDFGPLRGLRRKADLVFRGPRVAVYIDGCFWHGCPAHGTWPKANATFWRNKIQTNQQRDVDTDRRLEDAGWEVIRIWENEDPRAAGERIASVVRSRVDELRTRDSQSP